MGDEGDFDIDAMLEAPYAKEVTRWQTFGVSAKAAGVRAAAGVSQIPPWTNVWCMSKNCETCRDLLNV